MNDVVSGHIKVLLGCLFRDIVSNIFRCVLEVLNSTNLAGGHQAPMMNIIKEKDV